MLPLLSLPALLGGLASAYLAGQASRPLHYFIKPLLGAAGLGAAISHPKQSILLPFRLTGRAIGFMFGFARRSSSNTAIETFKMTVEDELVSMYVRRDLYQAVVSVVFLVVFVGGSIVIYKFLVIIIYKLYKDVTNRWTKLTNNPTKPNLTKEQLRAISQIMELKSSDKPFSNGQSSSYKITD